MLNLLKFSSLTHISSNAILQSEEWETRFWVITNQILRFCFQKYFDKLLGLGQQGTFNSLTYYLPVELGILLIYLFTLLSALLLDGQFCDVYSPISFQFCSPLFTRFVIDVRTEFVNMNFTA